MKKKKIKLKLEDFQLESFLSPPEEQSLNLYGASGTYTAGCYDPSILDPPTKPVWVCVAETISFSFEGCPIGVTSDMSLDCKTPRNQCPPPPPPPSPISPTSIDFLCPPGSCPTAPYISCA